MIDWSKYAPYITPEEAMCRCGQCGIESAENMDPDFLDTILQLRLTCAFPFKFSSMYRCEHHPAEIVKGKPGTHFLGKAADIACMNDQAFKLTMFATSHPNIRAVRFAQKGEHSERFIHLDSFNRGYHHVGSY